MQAQSSILPYVRQRRDDAMLNRIFLSVSRALGLLKQQQHGNPAQGFTPPATAVTRNLNSETGTDQHPSIACSVICKLLISDSVLDLFARFRALQNFCLRFEFSKRNIQLAFQRTANSTHESACVRPLPLKHVDVVITGI